MTNSETEDLLPERAFCTICSSSCSLSLAAAVPSHYRNQASCALQKLLGNFPDSGLDHCIQSIRKQAIGGCDCTILNILNMRKASDRWM